MIDVVKWGGRELDKEDTTYNRFSPYGTGTTVVNDPGGGGGGCLLITLRESFWVWTNKINSLKMWQVLELNITSDYFNFSILPQQGWDGSFCTASACEWQSEHSMEWHGLWFGWHDKPPCIKQSDELCHSSHFLSLCHCVLHLITNLAHGELHFQVIFCFFKEFGRGHILCSSKTKYIVWT